jgi:hypothetical protein
VLWHLSNFLCLDTRHNFCSEREEGTRRGRGKGRGWGRVGGGGVGVGRVGLTGPVR